MYLIFVGTIGYINIEPFKLRLLFDRTDGQVVTEIDSPVRSSFEPWDFSGENLLNSLTSIG